MTSSASNRAQGSLRTILTDVGITVEPEAFLCQGSFLIKAIGHPNKDEIAEAVKFAQRLIKEGKTND